MAMFDFIKKLDMAEPKSVTSCWWFLLGGLATAGWGYLQGDPLVIYAGATHIILAGASAGFHWTKTYWWQKADEIAMIGFFLALFVRQIGALVPGWDLPLILAGLALSVAMGVTHRRWNNDSTGLMALFNLVVLMIRGGWIQLIAAFGLYVVALRFQRNSQIGDTDFYKDDPHAWWHRLSALANTITTI